MFKFLFRRTLPKTLSKEDKDTVVALRKDLFKMNFVSSIMLCIFTTLPLSALINTLILTEHSLDNVIGILLLIASYCIFAIWFLRRFSEPIMIFKRLIFANLYSSLYTVKGKALLKEDFDKIKEENKTLYLLLMNLQCEGYCYGISFDILQCLKKGEIKFIAVKEICDEDADAESYFTMHVVYVNNDWCFDTYSQKQYPLEFLMKTFKAKSYKSFSYSDIEGKSYGEFRAEHYPLLKKWCEENDCSEKWLKD